MKTSIEWISHLFSGRESCTLEKCDHGFVLRGDAELIIEEKTANFTYTVSCNPDWATKSAQVLGTLGPTAITLNMEVKKGGGWFRNGREQPQLTGCTDIDLGFTPATNTIPIRRLGLAIGEEAKIQVAWLKIPAFELVPLIQFYKRVAADEYIYRSQNEGSTSSMTVNSAGMVLAYSDYWHEIPNQ